MSELVKRVLVAFVAIPAIFLICYVGGISLLLFTMVLAFIGLTEYFHIAEAKGAKPQRFLGYSLTLLLLGLFYTPEGLPEFHNWVITALFFTALLLMLVELFGSRGSAVLNLSSTAFGVLYIGLSFGMFLGLRDLRGTESWQIIIAMFKCIWLCDSAAYFGGKAFGKHKLLERVSPKKTWEGAISGLAGALLGAFVARALFLHFVTIFQTLVIGVAAGTLGQLGDLFESLLKRDANIKDSSTLIPGHGGVLDRFDSLMFVAPVLYMYFKYLA